MEDAILVEVNKTTSLFNIRGWETESISLVVGEFRVDEVVDLDGVVRVCTLLAIW